jgi:transposase
MKTDFYFGIDVSKGYADFILLDSNRKVIGKPFQLFDVSEGYEALAQYVQKVVNEYHPQHIYAAVESTGSLENHWLDVVYNLREMYPISIARLNPLGVAKHRQADLKVQVTDRSSAEAIARYLINHADRIEYYRPDEYAKYRHYLSHIELMVKHKTQLTNKLRQHLYQCFPEVIPYIRSTLPRSVLELLCKYPTSEAMSRARLSKNCNIAYFTQSDWLAIRDRCKLCKYEGPDPLAEQMIKDTAHQLIAYSDRIGKMYDLLGSQLPKDKLQILMSIPGVAEKSAITILCLIGDVRRFTSPHQIVGYFGLYPVNKVSGDGKKKPHLCRKGNALLRKRLYMSAMVASNHDQYLRSLYLKLVDRGVPKKSAICVVMKKMLRMIYGMLRTNQSYNPKVDEAYRERYQQKAEANIAEKGPLQHIDQSILMHAPISKRNAHHRKEQTKAYMQTRSPG